MVNPLFNWSMLTQIRQLSRNRATSPYVFVIGVLVARSLADPFLLLMWLDPWKQYEYAKTGDEAVVPLFRESVADKISKSDAAGRVRSHDDVEAVEIRFAGSRNYGVYPANEMSHWIADRYTGEQRAITTLSGSSVNTDSLRTSVRRPKRTRR